VLPLDERCTGRYGFPVSDQAAVLEAALQLPTDQRADLASELLRSLDADEATLPQAEVERRWSAELARRAERALRGESTGRDATSVLSEIEAKLRAR